MRSQRRLRAAPTASAGADASTGAAPAGDRAMAPPVSLTPA